MASRYATGEFDDTDRRPGTSPRDPVLRAGGAYTSVTILKDKHQHQVATLYETAYPDGTVIERHVIDYIDDHGTKWHRLDSVPSRRA